MCVCVCVCVWGGGGGHKICTLGEGLLFFYSTTGGGPKSFN